MDRPPLILSRLIGLCIPPRERDAMLRDLDRAYAKQLATRGQRSASGWYLRQTLGFLLRLGPRRVLQVSIEGLDIRADLRAASRNLRRRPSFAAAFVLTLAIGIGGLAAIYSTANWVMLRPIPGVGDPDELVMIQLGSTQISVASWGLSHPDLLTLSERLSDLCTLAAYSSQDVHLGTGGVGTIRTRAEVVTGDYFDLLRVRPAAGRMFLPEEGLPGEGTDLVVVAYGTARREWGSPAAAIGERLYLNGIPFRVVGVAPPGFGGSELPEMSEVWVPLGGASRLQSTYSADSAADRGAPMWERMVGRLKPGATPAQVRTAAAATMAAVVAEYRTFSYSATHFELQVFPGIGLKPTLRASVRRTLGILAAAGLLLLILAIINVVSLSMAHASSRRSATTTRLALGSGRFRIARETVVESAVLGVVGALVGLLMATGWAAWFQDSRLAERGAALAGMHPDLRVALFTILVSVAAGVLAGTATAMAAHHGSAAEALRTARHGDAAAHRLRSVLVTLQVALAVVMVVGAGLLVRTVLNYRSVDLGFPIGRLYTFTIDPYLQGYDRGETLTLLQEIEDGLSAQEGITSAGFVSPAPLWSSYVTYWLRPEGGGEDDGIVGAGYGVTPGFLRSLGAQPIQGSPPPAPGGAHVVYIAESMARKLFPDVPPTAVVGRTVERPVWRQTPVPFRVGAVLEDMHLSGFGEDPTPAIFYPWASSTWEDVAIGFVRVTDPAVPIAEMVREEVARHAPELPIFDTATARERVDRIFADRIILARVAVALGLLGVVLASVGLFGVLTYAVSERRREIGIRAALGATPGALIGGVVRTGLLLTGTGIVLGLGASAFLSRLLVAYLYDVGRMDPLVYLAGTVLVLLVASGASLIPSRRAARISPMEVLRSE